MVDPKLLALIHAEIDGALDDRQRAELARCLLADPATRAVRDEMRRLCKALDAVSAVEPPAQLRADILAALPQTRTRPATVDWQLPNWRYAAVLAGVLVIGTVVLRVMDGQGPAASEMAGTLAAPRAVATVDMVQLGQGPVSGRVSLVRDSAGLKLALELVTSASVDVLVESDGRSLRVNGLGQRNGQGEAPTMIALPGFGIDGRPVNLTFLMGDHEVARAVLRGPKGH